MIAAKISDKKQKHVFTAWFKNMSPHTGHTTWNVDVRSSSVPGRDSVVYAFSVRRDAKHLSNLQHFQFVQILQLFFLHTNKKNRKTWQNLKQLKVLTCLLLCEGDIGVHQAPSNAVGNIRIKMCSHAENTSYHQHKLTAASLTWCSGLWS